MAPLPLTSPEIAEAIRRVAGLADRSSRLAAWALEALDGDEALAAARLLDDARLAWVKSMLAHWSARPENSAEALSVWTKLLDAHQRLRTMSPAPPSPPRQITEWTHQRLGLRSDSSDAGRRARKIGLRGVHIDVFCAWPDAPARELAHRLALAVGAFPIGQGWTDHTAAR